MEIAIIDDDEQMRQSIARQVQLLPNARMALQASSVESFWEQLEPHTWIDLLFLDVDLPGQSGLDALPQLKKRLPKADIIILTISDADDHLLKALHGGASGWLNKDLSIANFQELLMVYRQGGALLSPRMAKKLILHFTPAPVTSPHWELSPKEIQLLRLFSEGYSYAKAATAMGLTVDGVRYYVKSIYQKMGVKSKSAAVKTFLNISSSGKEDSTAP
ncbi:response regulator transcription factor [Neolewinella lacunae]|uniref:Response regulator transcription factor n=1 Tax=Neolewinella lacunae TaxID=1517758 RepID=A0A923T713_9BACT|nr:response regulator transcription factor [Neolewinella lacunae]MBC6993146.1 response regulator transcription factor [Neolewinella lacunae]MDN3633120.1 response regulator transcription factor [Neolewinella lacunae]